MSVQHYENFPVASWLCPAPIRPAVVAIYHFARTADDLADEGDADAETRLASLARYRGCLEAALHGIEASSPWPGVFVPLAEAIARHALPAAPMHALLDAFEQDVHHPAYADRNALLGYCGLSANPVGRLLLHLYGIGDARALRASDAICSALQLANFWQDLGRDLRQGRCYLPVVDLQARGLSRQDLLANPDAPVHAPALARLVADLVGWTRALMHEGAPLARRVPGRAGWELRLVVQGGLRILDRIEAMDFAVLTRRPVLGPRDLPVMLWRAMRMPAPTP